MKLRSTIMLSIALIGSMTLTSSCKKNWTCTCSTAGQTTNHEIDNETLLNARSKCKSYEGSVLGVTTSCTLNE